MSVISKTPQKAYPITARNKVKRSHERANYDRQAVYAVLDASMMCHVAYVIDGQPYATPTIHWREGDWLYWHGSSASRMLRSQVDHLPVCVTVAMLDGLVMARTGFHHSANYRSAMCFGKGRLILDSEQKKSALLAMIERYFPGRNEALRSFSAKELKATKVIGMPIEEAVAKVRDTGVIDDAEDMDHPVWAGVIPVRTVIGEAQADPDCLVDGPGAGLEAYSSGKSLDQVFKKLQPDY